jgi:signal transduction histidine kinase
MDAYARLARLPAPRRRQVDVESLVRRVAGMETRVPLRVAGGPTLAVRIDPDQVEQVLINLLRNAADAALETGGGVDVAWSALPRAGFVEVRIDDEGVTIDLVPAPGADTGLERYAASTRRDLLEQVLGVPVTFTGPEV